jgi:hypothetical protein
MLLPCEVIVKNYLPAVRASVAKQLAKNYGMDQREIASCLGLTQPAVNNYLAGRYGAGIKDFERDRGLRKLSGKLAREAAEHSGREARSFVVQGICGFCKELRSQGPVCALHRKSVPMAEKCTLCMK